MVFTKTSRHFITVACSSHISLLLMDYPGLKLSSCKKIEIGNFLRLLIMNANV